MKFFRRLTKLVVNTSIGACLISPTLITFPKTASALTWREIAPTDNPDLLDPKNLPERNIFKLDTAPKAVELEKPWADFLWKLNAGLLGFRYADKDFLSQGSWLERREYIRRNPMQNALALKGAERAKAINDLSPSEKYDLLVGDHLGTLTNTNWAEGEKHYREGKLQEWMGICEGTAAAMIRYPEPKHFVDLKTPDGDIIRFRILDIKGLASLLWSSYNVSIPSSGTHCSKNSFPQDTDGIVTDQSCFDPNPASFHIALIHFLYKKHSPFILNRDTSREVWNVPVVGYELTYFNLKNGKTTTVMTDAVVKRDELKKDKFHNYRSTEGTYLIGVDAKVKLAIGYTGNVNRQAQAKVREVHYRYDLELDSNGLIVGGEWYNNNHPDFLWALDPNERPFTVGDIQIDKNIPWDGSPFSPSWQAAARASSRANLPLEKVVTKLMELSIK